MAGTLLLTRSVRRHQVASVAAAYRPAVAAPMMVVLAFAVAAPVSILFAAAGEGPHPLVMLVLLSAAAFAVGLAADLLGAAAVGLVFWLFFDGFDAHRWGVLGWDGRTDAVRLGVLVAAGMLGALVAYLRHLRRVGGLRRVSAGAGRPAADGSGRTSGE